MAIANTRDVVITKDGLLNYKVQQGDQFDAVNITAIGKEGDGIGHLPNGMVVIVQDKRLQKGNVVDVVITKVKEKVCFARLA